MQILTTALKNSIKKLPTGRKLKGDEKNCSLAFLLMKHFQYIQTKAFSANAIKPLRVGGPIGSIFTLLEVPVNLRRSKPFEFMNHKYLVTLRIVESKPVDDSIIYKFQHLSLGPSRIALPNRDLTTIHRRGNIVFLPLESALATRQQRQQSTTPVSGPVVPPTVESPPAPPSEKKGSNPNQSKQRKASERSPDSDEGFNPQIYLPEEYPTTGLPKHSKEGHTRTNGLVKLNRWMVKKLAKISKKEKELAQRVAELESRTANAPIPQDPPVVERRHSVSTDSRRVAPREVTPTPARRSVAESRAPTRITRNTRQRNQEVLRDPFEVDDETAELFKD